MFAHTPCQACGARRWEGDPPRCGGCGAARVLDAVAAEEDRLPEMAAPPSDEVARLAGGHRVAGLAAPQRLVYALLAATLEEFRQADRLSFTLSYALGPLLGVVGGAAALGFMAGAYGLLALAGDRAVYALYLGPLLAFAVARTMKEDDEKGKIDLDVVRGKVVGLKLGRLAGVFHLGAAASPLIFIGVAFGMMWGLLYFTPDHAAAPIRGTFAECFWVTTDNLTHGVLLDVCEMYDLRLGPKINHTTQSATVFLLFRLAFDALALLMVYQSWQRWGLRQLMNDLPAVRDFDGLLGWLARTCADRGRLPTRYLDEVLFLVLTKEYLSGNYALVRQLSEQFPQLPVTRRLRELYRGPGGEVIFEGATREQS